MSLSFWLSPFDLADLHRWGGHTTLHQPVGELCDSVSFDILLYHSGELNYFLPIFLLFVFDLPGKLERFVFLAEY